MNNFPDFVQEQFTNAINASYTGSTFKSNIQEHELQKFKTMLIAEMKKDPGFLAEMANKAHQEVIDHHYVPVNKKEFVEKVRNTDSNEFKQVHSALSNHVSDMVQNKKPSFNQNFNELSKPLIANIKKVYNETSDLREVIGKETKEFLKEKIKQNSPAAILVNTFLGTIVEKGIQLAKTGEKIFAGLGVVCAIVSQGLSYASKYGEKLSEKISGKTSEMAPEKTPERTSEKAPEKTSRTPLEKTSEEAPQKTSRKTSEKTAEETPKKTSRKNSGETSEEAPKKTSRKTSEKTSEETPKKTSRKTSGETSEKAPKKTSRKTSGETSEEAPKKTSRKTSGKASPATPDIEAKPLIHEMIPDQAKIKVNNLVFKGNELSKILNFDNKPFSLSGNGKIGNRDYELAHRVEKTILDMVPGVNKDEFQKDMTNNQMMEFLKTTASKMRPHLDLKSKIDDFIKVAGNIAKSQESNGNSTLSSLRSSNDTRSFFASLNQTIRENPRVLDQAISQLQNNTKTVTASRR